MQSELLLLPTHHQNYLALMNFLRGTPAPNKSRMRNKQRINTFRRFGMKCYSCNCEMTRVRNSRSEATIDHIIPRYYGGPSNQFNSAAKCAKCNSEKGFQADRAEVLAYFGLTEDDVKDLV